MTIRSKPALLWLVASQVLYVLSLAPWAALAGVSLKAFDAPGATDVWAVWVFVGLMWAYPLLPIVCATVAWMCYWRGRMRAAVIATSVPIILVVLIVLGQRLKSLLP